MGQPESAKTLKRHERAKEIEKRIKELEREVANADQIMTDLGMQRKKADIELKQARNHLDQITPKEIGISDHALLRYLERHLNINVEAARFDMMEKVKCLKDFGSTVTVGSFVVKNNVVVTYLPEKE